MRHLNPDLYETPDGLSKLVAVLRESPLQAMPVPDLFKRLDQWHHLRRQGNESIPAFLVREEDMFVQLQDALQRARSDSQPGLQRADLPETAAAEQRGPPSTPSQSPIGRGVQRMTIPASTGQASGGQASTGGLEASVVGDFFSDELRGYRLIKGARLTATERQNVLTQTGNRTAFYMVRRALRTLFSEDEENWAGRRQRIWYGDSLESRDYEDAWQGADDSGTYATWWYEDEPYDESSPWSAYYGEDAGYAGYDDWNGYEEEPQDLPVDENNEDPEELQYKEAFALANEATRALTQAREAVRKVRAARGYFAPESSSGKGLQGSPSSSASGSSKGYGYGGGKSKSTGAGKGKSFGPCFICGMNTHSYVNCPDRFAKGKGHSKTKGFSKGFKGKKGKGKGFSKSVQFHDLSLSHPGVYLAEAIQNNRVILDTGASENAVGMESLQRLVNNCNMKYDVDLHDRPVFRFGNGQQLQATSRVDLHNTALGSISFYVLAGEAYMTPPLMGGKTLRNLKATVSYQNDLLLYCRQEPQIQWYAVKMYSHSFNHISIDLMEKAVHMQDPSLWYVVENAPSVDRHEHAATVTEPAILMMSTGSARVSDLSPQLSSLAQRLRALQAFAGDGTQDSSMCGRRSTCEELPLFRSSPTEATTEPACNLADMPEVRPQDQLPLQEANGRITQVHGSSPALGDSGNSGDRESDAGRPSDREGGDGQIDGIERSSTSERPHRDILHQHDLARIPEANGLYPEPQGPSGDQRDIDPNQGQGQGNFGSEEKISDRIAPGSSRILLEATRLGQSGPRTHSEGTSGLCARQDIGAIAGRAQDSQEVGGSPNDLVRRGDLECSGVNTCRILGSKDQERAQGEERTTSGIWKALKGLQAKMRGTPASHESTTSTTTMACAIDFEGSKPIECDQNGIAKHLSGTRKTCFGGGNQCCDHANGANLKFQGSQGHDGNAVEQQLPKPGPGGGKKKGISPFVARKLASNAAMIGALTLISFRSLMSQLSHTLDFVEVACAPTSSLSASMEEMGFSIQRVNYLEGYDLDVKSGTNKFKQLLQDRHPRHVWVSLKCTRLSSLNNLTQRDDHEEAAFQKRRFRDLKRADEIVEGLETTMIDGNDFSWEWPTRASAGWNSKAISRLQRLAHKHHRHLYWCHFHGCAYGLEFNGFPVQKSWTVVTTCREVWLGLQRRCPGHVDHVHCRGKVAQASSYYPPAMVKAVTKAIAFSWIRTEEKAGTSVGRDLSIHLLQAQQQVEHLDNLSGCHTGYECRQGLHYEAQLRKEQPKVLALTRNRFPVEMPKGKQLEMIRSQMLRVHKAAGHPSMARLQQLLRARQAPDWAVALAGQIQCPACAESKRPISPPVASLHETPGLMEIIGADIFESDHNGKKFKFMLVRDRASGLVMVDLLKEFGGEEEPSSWEPTTETVIATFTKWMMHNPAPKWILTDSATYFTSQRMMDFAGNSGLGLLTTPAESHQMLGAEEGAINIIRNTVSRLLKDDETLDIAVAYQLAAHGHNQCIGPSGYSPFQWTTGSSSPMENLPIGINPRKAFDGMLKLKEKARVAYEMESAKSRLSKLNNTIPQPVQTFRPGQLVMLWRQRPRPGKLAGSWIGPVRVLLQEGGTIWVATGATLIRARAVQLRQCTKREELNSHLEGTAILQMPVTLESLLRNFTGRHFSDVTGDVPSMEQMQDDVQGSEVVAEPSQQVRPDSWSFKQDGGKRWLVRIHNMPRLSLFSPQRMTSLPIPEEELSGLRKTKVKGMSSTSEAIILEDDYKESDDPHRSLQDRWRGETWLEIKATSRQPQSEASKARKVKVDRKRKADDPLPSKEEMAETAEDQGRLDLDRGQEPQSGGHEETPDDDGLRIESESSQPADGALLPRVPAISPLTTALRSLGPDAVDGVPARVNEPTGPQCSVDACQLPGGHSGPHEDGDGQQFTWDESQGRLNLDDDNASNATSSSEELLIVSPADKIYDNTVVQQVPQPDPQECFYALEIDILPTDTKYLGSNPHKWSIWLSKKMQEKGKEKRWNQMSLEEKKQFDLAQAKELSNVLGAKALRSLTSQEMENLDPKTVASMRWVLTVKGDGTPKARLVVLGFQMGNITEVETAAPTMARVSRYLLLTLCANCGYRLKAGDVTAAFLQADASLEDKEMTIWAPAELAVVFGADPNHPVLPLRISKAFYGLVQAPRCWFNDISAKLMKQGWKSVLADRCLFVLYDDETNEVIGACGLHVDDLLICGDEDHPKFKKAEAELMTTYKWGKWQTGDIDFAGCHILQFADGSLRVDQQTYVEKWLDEIPLSKERQKQLKSSLTPNEISQLRGAIGTIAWKSAQTGPHFQADAGILLSEIPYANVNTILKTNKIIRELKREAHQGLTFPCWKRHWRDLVAVTWCDAGQQNRADKSSTMGFLTALAPKEILDGEEVSIAILNWKSSKCPRQCLGSNGSEVQAVTAGEDETFRIRAQWAEIHGVQLDRNNLYDQVRDQTQGIIVMDTRGIYDAMSRNVSSLHGLRSSRAGYELTLAVQQAMRIKTGFRWVNGLAMLADCLTKFSERRIFWQFLAEGQKWRIVHDPKFIAGKKLKKRELVQATREMEQNFIGFVKQLAFENKWPWQDPDEFRSMVDVNYHDPFELVTQVNSS